MSKLFNNSSIATWRHADSNLLHIDIVSILQFPKNSTLFIDIHFCYRNTSIEYFLKIILKKNLPPLHNYVMFFNNCWSCRHGRHGRHCRQSWHITQ